DDFSITASPVSLTVTAGDTVTSKITTTVTTGAAQNINLTVAGVPTGATGMFTSASVTAGGGSTLTIKTDASTPARTYTLTVPGTGTTAPHTATVTLTVQAPPVDFDFSLSVSPTAVTLRPGDSGMAAVTTALVAGAAHDIALSVTGLPSGVTGTIAPTSV